MLTSLKWKMDVRGINLRVWLLEFQMEVFFSLKGELINDLEISRNLAFVADLYVNDCFLNDDRTDACVVGVSKFLRPSVAGFLV